MGKIVIRNFKVVAAAIFTILCVYLVVRFIAAMTNGYTVSEMDWNDDGKTTLNEIYDASDISTRVIKMEELDCTEFFSLKDGLTIKTKCKTKGSDTMINDEI